MKKKSSYSLKQTLNSLWIGIIILVVAIFWNLYFSNALKEKEEFLTHAEETVARIVDIEYKSQIDREEIKRVRIEYYVGENKYTGMLNEISNKMYIGQEEKIFYDINNPSSFIQNNKVTNFLFKYMGYLLLIIALAQIINSVRKIILYLSTRNSREVMAKIERIIDKSNSVYEEYIIECYWIDEKGEKYIFYSNPYRDSSVIEVIEEMNIKELPVRVKSKRKYVVITDKIDKKLSV